MFAGFKPLKPLFHSDSDRLSDEQRYWDRLKEVSVFQENGNVTSTDFMPVDPYHVGATFSNTFALYETSNCNLIATYNKMKSPLHCASFRPDGQIIALGSHDGTVRVLRVAKGKTAAKCSVHPIQNLPKAHRHAVNCVAFAPPIGVNFATLADDGAVRMWDLSDARGTEAEPLWSADTAHSDQARSAVFGVRNSNTLITGAYDHKVKLWDVRTDSDGAAPKLEIDHGCPVEKILLFPNETIVASAGGTTIKLWDIVAGGKLLHTMENHFKTITSLCFATNKTYLLSGGMDRRINLFRCNSGDFALVKSWKVAAPVLSLSMTPDDSRMAFGMSNLLTIYRRKSEKELHDAMQNGHLNSSEINGRAIGSDLPNGIGESSKSRKRPAKQQLPLVVDPDSGEKPVRRIAAPRVVQRQRPEDGNAPKTVVVELSARYANQLKIGQLDRMLRDRRYREFFASAVSRCGLNNGQPEFAVAALQQLSVRQKLPLALSGHPEGILQEFLRFLELNLFIAPFFDVLYEAFNVFLDIYAAKQLSVEFVKSMEKLKKAVVNEIEMREELAMCLGVMSMICFRPANDALRNAAAMASTSEEKKESNNSPVKPAVKPEVSDAVNGGEDDTTNDTIADENPQNGGVGGRIIVVNADRAKQSLKTVVWSF